MARYVGERWNELYRDTNDGKIVSISAGGRIYDSLQEAAEKFEYDRCYIKIDEDVWVHRTMLKRIINPILRFCQFWTDNPYVIASITDMKDGLPYFSHYAIKRVKKFKKFEKIWND